MTPILTRYLYVKDEVMFSLWKALLDKRDDEAKFWCYELYYSGFKEETIVFLLQIYYDFYASYNPRLECFLLRITNEWLKNKKKDWIPGAIVENLLQRSCATECFMLQYLKEKKKHDNEWLCKSKMYTEIIYVAECQTEGAFIDWFLDENHAEIKREVKEKIDDIIAVLKQLLPEKNDITTRQMVNMGKSATIAHLLQTILELPYDKRFYFVLDNELIAHYKTALHLPSKGRTVLKKSQLYPIIVDGVSLFDFSRKEQTKTEFYVMLRDWIYYASYSPLWQQRIIKYRGTVNHNKKDVEFTDDDLEEFYSYFSYELDEEDIEFRPPAPELFYDDETIINKFPNITNVPYFTNSE